MNRLTQRLTTLMAERGKAFIAYIMAGVPSWSATRDIILGLEKAGVTAIELGVPFSDPIADGPIIQAAGNQALSLGVTLPEIYQNVEIIRKDSDLPILLMGYWNVFLQYGRAKSLDVARGVGVDGLIIPDLPPEADPDFFRLAVEREVCTVLLATTSTSEDRLKGLLDCCTGFLYFVPQLGITGLDLRITDIIRDKITGLRSLTSLPVCVGIGIKTREEVAAMNELADGVIVGSRIVSFIEEHKSNNDLGSQTGELVKNLLT